MAVEIEKKIRLTGEQYDELPSKLEKIGAKARGSRFERNVLYSNEETEINGGIIRLRDNGDSAQLTFKRSLPSENGLKTQLEFETDVGSHTETEKIIEHIGLKKRLIYEKRRAIWEFINAEVVLDELPFGFFVEIEGTVEQISFIERALGLDGFDPELKSYPALTAEYGLHEGDLIVAKFEK